MLEDPRGLEVRARQLVDPIAEAFCASRLGGEWGHAFGTLPPEVDVGAILTRAAGGE
jgi:hypothetical protein